MGFATSGGDANAPVSWEMILRLMPLFVAYFLDTADVAYFNGVFRALEVDLGLTMYHLTIMQASVGVANLCFGPIWAILADRGIASRKMLLVVSSGGWGFTSIAIGAFATNFYQLLGLRFLNSMFLCSGSPIAQSIIASVVPTNQRGRCFGMFGMAGSAGVISMSQLSVTISEMDIFGTTGWRVGLFVIGVISIVFSAGIAAFMEEPPMKVAPQDSSVGPMTAVKNLAEHWKVHSFRTLAIAGSACSFAWQVMTFSTLWFQYCGLPDWQAGLVTSCWHIGDLLANLGGGIVSDKLHRRNPLHGRQYMAQTSIACALPVLLMLFAVVPKGPESAPFFGVLMFFYGISVGSVVSSVNKPILSQVAPKEHVASMMSWEMTLENVIGSMWGPGLLFGLNSLTGYTKTSQKVSEMPMLVREHNAHSLAFTILCFTWFSYSCVVIGYTILHRSFKQDLKEMTKMKGAVVDKAIKKQNELEDGERAPLITSHS